jgi:hypothetical protein
MDVLQASGDNLHSCYFHQLAIIYVGAEYLWQIQEYYFWACHGSALSLVPLNKLDAILELLPQLVWLTHVDCWGSVFVITLCETVLLAGAGLS